MRFVHALRLMVLLMCMSALCAWGTTVTSTTKIIGPDGQPFSGTITLQLPFAGVNTTTNQLVLALPVTANVFNGIITPPIAVTGNDVMSPAMPYSALYTDLSGVPVTKQLYYITGTTFDVGSAPATPNFLNTNIVSATLLTVTGVSSLNGGISLPIGILIKWNNDVGISRIAANGLAIGNGTQGDATGTVKFGVLILPTASNTLPVVITNDGTGGITLQTNAGKIWAISNTGNLTSPAGNNIILQGATSGTITIGVPSIAGAQTVTFPLTTPNSSNTVTLIQGGATNCGTQGPTTSITGTGAPADIYTCTLLANQVALGKVLDIACGGVHDVGTVNTSITVNLNGQNIVSGSTGTTASQSFAIGGKLLNTGPTTGFVWGIAQNTAGSLSPFSIVVTGLNWAANQTLNCRFSVAATDHITGGVWVPQVIQ